MTIRVVLTDDQPLVRAALQMVITDTTDIEVVGEAGDGAAGDALIAPAVTRRLIKEFTARPATSPPRRSELDAITAREREVLTLVGRGLSNTEIAGELSISIATAKTYLTRLLAKLNARDRVQLVILAYEAGLVATSR
ncbi:response regulator transcription factor [Streptomyces goshikiensis]|uniref:response regulator transcription factor n=1 Tax=Streptomyces goshikiensis TaxID=1942 RepID=UPI003326B9BD